MVNEDTAARTPGQRRGLTREAVLSAALAIVDAEGLEALGVRRLAKELDVYPAAVTWHVGSKDRLLAEVATFALGEVVPAGAPADPEDWRGWMRDLMLRYRGALHRHPGIAPLLSTRLSSRAGVSVEIAEAMVAVLEGAGFAGPALVRAYNAIFGTMIGWVGLELTASPPTGAEQESLRDRLRAITAEEHPAIARHGDVLLNRAFVLRWEGGSENRLDDSFGATIDALLAGLSHGESASPADRS